MPRPRQITAATVRRVAPALPEAVERAHSDLMTDAWRLVAPKRLAASEH